MRRKALIAVVTAAIVGAALGIASLVSAAAHERHGGKRLIAITTQQNFLDLGNAGPTLGDVFAFHDALYNRQHHRVGHDGGSCTLVSSSGESNCTVTFSLRDGQLAFQGLITPHQNGLFTATIPITGGAGDFRHASGDATVEQVTETKAIITLHLRI